jgi:hypothetical protein
MGVLSYTFPTSTLNFMTFTAKRWGYFPIITLVGGGAAGQEVATTDSNHNIFVQIQSGVSTNTQVKAAIDATIPSPTGMSAGDYVSVAITSGHNNDTNVPGSSPAMTGAAQPDIQGFYSDEGIAPLTSTFQLFQFPMLSRHIMLLNREKNGLKGIVYSWDGINNHGFLAAGESTMLDKSNAPHVFLKYINGAPSYKLMAKTNV